MTPYKFICHKMFNVLVFFMNGIFQTNSQSLYQNEKKLILIVLKLKEKYFL